jgi:hypothetical protein
MAARGSQRSPSPLIEWARDAGVSREEQIFLNERIAFFAALIAVISICFLIISTVANLIFASTEVVVANLVSLESVFQLCAVAVSGLQWLLCRKGRRTLPELATIDSLGIWLVMSFYGAMILFGQDGVLAVHELMAFMLITLTIVFARGVIVPASTMRTAAISAIACIPVVVVSVIARGGQGPDGQPMTIEAGLYIGTWSCVAVILASASARTIYGLRAQVRAATQLGQYTLEEKIGEGGMGAVYRARHALLRRPTAVKLLPAHRAGEVQVQRFEKEVQLTSALTHPNTINIYDYGHAEDGTFYYAMEYLDGFTLEDLVAAEGPIPAERVAHIIAQAAGALTEAHHVGLIHRDVKPANIMLCARGGLFDHVKVLDFGLVKELDDPATHQLSGTNVLVGTPLYLSPEAITDGDRVDARSDLYGLGAVAYFLLTGTPPFDGKGLVEICSKHLHAAPERPSQRLGEAIPPPFEALVLACLAKSPDDRPASARELVRRIEACRLQPWGDQQAQTWWSERAPQIARGKRRAKPESGVTVAVDLTRRATSLAD